MNWIQGSRMFRTGRYQAIRNAMGTAVTKPRAKPATTEIILLMKSVARMPRSMTVARACKIAGRKGKLRAVLGLTDRKNHSAMATRKEMSSHPQFGIWILLFFLSSMLNSPFNRIP